MYEVEAKAKAKKGTEKTIQKIARKAGEERQEDTYFTHPCRNFAETDEAFRIRNVGGKLTLTYKGPKLDRQTKSRAELETPVKPEMFQILESLGFKKFMRIRKLRKNYLAGKAIISIDKVAGLGTYIEIEKAAGSLKELKKSKREVLALLERLGYSRKASITKTYFELLLEKGKH